MSEYLDEATIPTITEPSATESIDYVEAETLSGVTTPSANELHVIPDLATVSCITTLSYIESGSFTEAIIGTTTTVLVPVDVTEFIDAGTVAGITSLLTAEQTHVKLTTRDYFNNPISTEIDYDTSYPVAGSVGRNDTDNGVLS